MQFVQTLACLLMNVIFFLTTTQGKRNGNQVFSVIRTTFKYFFRMDTHCYELKNYIKLCYMCTEYQIDITIPLIKKFT